ncbi:vWA domain-containing protein [Fodinibius sp. Rm-B-1B1-1]|uniref:vWA domain-containing protein n=1 Tax=Fodinibius alkaliphilus TaxID=3140241 RepID=UPI00315B1035
MDFIFQGFQASLPLWVYILIFISTTVLSWWSYSTIQSVPKKFRYTLITLRALVFGILLLVLINPFIKTETSYLEPANILVLLDNSASTNIQKADYQGRDSYNEVLNTLRFPESDAVNLNPLSFGNRVNPTSFDSLTFNDDQTDLSAAVEAIQGQENDINAAILVSDGIYTMGRNPIYETSDLEIPVFTIGVGDTTIQEDVLVSSISTNSSGYLNTTQSVTVTINSQGFQGASIPVELRKGDEILSTKTVVPEIENSSSEINFELLLNQEGLQQYEIHIPTLEGEWTAENNTQRFSIDVQDTKQRILSLALEVHPDVRFVRSLLLSDENTSLTNRTWLQGNRFIEGDFDVDPDSLDLVIIHGYPQTGLSADIETRLKLIIEEVPYIVAATPQFGAGRFEEEIAQLPVNAGDLRNYSPVTLHLNIENTDHPILELTPVTFNRLPPLAFPTDNIMPVTGTQVLFQSVHQGEPTGQPVITVQELGNRRQAMIAAFNWYRYQQNPNAEVQQFVRQLWQNIISWTATDPDNELLDMQPQKSSFSGSENVMFNASLVNERGESEPDANIMVTIQSDSMESRTYSMEHVNNGNYRLNLTPLPEGLYSFEGSAQKGDRVLDTQKGKFSVSASNAEFINTTRNDQLLRQLAQRTDGEYIPFDSLANFWDRLNGRELLNSQEKTETDFFYLHQHLGWFLLMILLLCAEWIIRKYLSLP